MKKIVILSCLIALCLLTCLIPFTSAFAKESNTNFVSKEIKNLNDYNSRSAYVVDFDSGTTLFERNADQKYPIASMVKIMTLNLIFEEIESGNLSFDEKIIISENASGMGGSQMFLDTGLEYTVSDLIKGIIVVSANDACVAMAERISGSTDAFVDLMNEKAKTYEMNNTNFVNVTGLPEDGQFSTARDVSKMMKNLLKHEEYYKYSSIFLENFNHPDGRITEFNNTNKLVKFYPGCDGGKTGFTSEAMYCLSATAKREDTRVIATVMGAQTSKDRNKEITDLFNYAFHNFKNVKILEKDKPIPVDATIKRAKTNDVKVAPSKTVSILSKKGVAPNYELDVKINDNLKAPINKGDCIGKILVIDKQTKQIIEEVDLISLTEIEGLSYIDSIRKIIEHWTLRV